MIGYPALRTIHLICGVFAAPALIMYGVSAVQMAHNRWFVMKPAVSEAMLMIRPGVTDGRQVAREVMAASGQIRGEIASVTAKDGSIEVRVVVPGTVHQIFYDGGSGRVRLRTSVAGVMGMLNRLHHAAGLRHDYVPLQLWGLLIAVVSGAVLGLGLTGIWMWWLRKQERTWGVVLLAANAVFAVVVLAMVRSAGP